MKSLKKYIKEDFTLKKKGNIFKHKYHPETKEELENLLEERLEEDENADLNDIDVSAITDMKQLFLGLDPSDIDISRWDVSNVKNMAFMFDGCENFNSNLSNWDVSSVTDMTQMFRGCETFNSEISQWDVSNVEEMDSMFYDCTNFNSDLSRWDVSNVTDMSYMFMKCSNFEGNGLEKWNMKNVLKTNYMFSHCYNFDGQTLKKWDISSIKEMRSMFEGCSKFNPDLSNWDVSNVKDMQAMFDGCTIFEGYGLENWNVSNVESIQYLFSGCRSLNCDLSLWNVNNAWTIDKMFEGCTKLEDNNLIPGWYGDGLVYEYNVFSCKLTGDTITEKLKKLLVNKIYFNRKNRSTKVTLHIDNAKQLITVDNTCDKVEATLIKWNKFFDSGWNIKFKDSHQSIAIRSGKAQEQSAKWPYIDDENVITIMKYIAQYNKNIGTMIINRFKGEAEMPLEWMTTLYIDEIRFTECKFETSMDLNNVLANKTKWKNTGIKLTSTSVRAQKYYQKLLS